MGLTLVLQRQGMNVNKQACRGPIFLPPGSYTFQWEKGKQGKGGVGRRVCLRVLCPQLTPKRWAGSRMAAGSHPREGRGIGLRAAGARAPTPPPGWGGRRQYQARLRHTGARPPSPDGPSESLQHTPPGGVLGTSPPQTLIQTKQAFSERSAVREAQAARVHARGSAHGRVSVGVRGPPVRRGPPRRRAADAAHLFPTALGFLHPRKLPIGGVQARMISVSSQTLFFRSVSDAAGYCLRSHDFCWANSSENRFITEPTALQVPLRPPYATGPPFHFFPLSFRLAGRPPRPWKLPSRLAERIGRSEGILLS